MTALNAFAKQLESHYARVFDVYVQCMSVEPPPFFFFIKKSSLKQSRKRSRLLPPLPKPPSFQKAGRRLDRKEGTKMKELEGTAGIGESLLRHCLHFAH